MAYSGGGALFLTVLVIGLCLTVERVGDASNDIFVWLGLNPREEVIVCLVVLVFSTVTTGMILGVFCRAIVSLARKMRK